MSRITAVMWVGFAAVLACGCQPVNEIAANSNEPVAAPLGTISVYQLAGRLDLQVISSSAHQAILKGRSNTVMLFADPGGRVFVNGRPVGDAGGITPVSDMLFIPAELTEEVRSAMRPAAPSRGPQIVSAEPPARNLVVLDPGHGGKDPGAGKYGIQEKDVNLSVALSVAGRLRADGIEIMLTRDDDTFVELDERAAIANRVEPRLFVSIHADSCPRPSVHGFSAYVARSPSARSVDAAKGILGSLRATGAISRGLKKADYRVLVRTTCPSVLVELGYLSNSFEATKLADAEYQSRLADAIAAGIANFLAAGR